MSSLSYVTIFPECESVHLKKDVGMLPYALGQRVIYKTKIVSYKSNFSEEEKSKFNIEGINKRFGATIDILLYLLRNGKKIDVLNLYHITSNRNAFWIWLYKWINKKGKVHLKLDADYRMFDIFSISPKKIKGKIRVNILLNKVDLYTIESNCMKDLVEKKWGIKAKLLPNGVCIKEKVGNLKEEEKKNVFLTVGRLGTEQKATEDLVNAYLKIIDQCDWDLWLVGPMEKGFEQWLKTFIDDNFQIKNRIKVLGNITDTSYLNEIYRQARVFVLPSKWEGFAIVLMEALLYGEYLVVSDKIPSIVDVGKQGEYASIVSYHDINALASTMLESTKAKFDTQTLNDRKRWIETNFTWKPISEELEHFLNLMTEGR